MKRGEVLEDFEAVMCLDVLRLGFATARSGEKRWRTTAVQNAGAFTKTPEIREASWSAPALWRFGRSAGKTGEEWKC